MKNWIWIVVLAAACMVGCSKQKEQVKEDITPPSAAEQDTKSVAAPDVDKLIEMEVYDIDFDPDVNGFVITMKALTGDVKGKLVQLIVGEREASVLRMKLARQSYLRPLTHDLALSLIDSVGGKVQYIVVDALREGVFLAKIYVSEKNNTLHHVDSRASDAIIIGVSTGTKIYFERDVVVSTATKTEADESDPSVL
jgi:bifunctional DNase/RNase